jgi:hypothetical protein
MAGVDAQLSHFLAGILGVNHPEVSDHNAGRGIGIFEAAQGHCRVGGHRSAYPDHLFLVRIWGQRGNDFRDACLRGTVEHNAERSVLVVLDHQHHRAPEEVVEARGGDQQLAGERIVHTLIVIASRQRRYARPISDYLPWGISGSYLEACNCEVICPCRRIDGRGGGRSTYGVCKGALSWQIERGHAGDVGLAGLGVVLATVYDDDEAGSPWSFWIYLDERGDDRQRDALGQIFRGRLGGTPDKQFPWAWKASDLLGVRAVAIELDHQRGEGWFRAGDYVSVRIDGPAAEDSEVTCVIPGHHQTGREVHSELIKVEDEALSFEVRGRCGFESGFEYSSSET